MSHNTHTNETEEFDDFDDGESFGDMIADIMDEADRDVTIHLMKDDVNEFKSSLVETLANISTADDARNAINDLFSGLREAVEDAFQDRIVAVEKAGYRTNQLRGPNGRWIKDPEVTERNAKAKEIKTAIKTAMSAKKAEMKQKIDSYIQERKKLTQYFVEQAKGGKKRGFTEEEKKKIRDTKKSFEQDTKNNVKKLYTKELTKVAHEVSKEKANKTVVESAIRGIASTSAGKQFNITEFSKKMSKQYGIPDTATREILRNNAGDKGPFMFTGSAGNFLRMNERYKEPKQRERVFKPKTQKEIEAQNKRKKRKE